MPPVSINESRTPSARAAAVDGSAVSARNGTGAHGFTITTNDVSIPRPTGFALLRVSAGSFLTFGLFVATLVGAKLYFVTHPADFPLESQASAFEWRMIWTLASCGLLGLLLAPYARFPDMWDRAVKHRHRLVVPVVWGVIYALVTIVRDLPNPSGDHLYYPASIPFYAFGAVFLEMLLRLFGVTLLTWLIAEILLLGHLRNASFWIANTLMSIYEPLPQLWEDLERVEQPVQLPVTVVNWAFHPLFLSNMLTGYLYRRFGFLSAVLFRMSFYAMWHVAYGNFRWEWPMVH